MLTATYLIEDFFGLLRVHNVIYQVGTVWN